VVEPFTEVGDPFRFFGDVDPDNGHYFITLQALYGIAFFKFRPTAGHKLPEQLSYYHRIDRLTYNNTASPVRLTWGSKYTQNHKRAIPEK
jgi:hypothetical protein